LGFWEDDMSEDWDDWEDDVCIYFTFQMMNELSNMPLLQKLEKYPEWLFKLYKN
jgi:hypothetical protein